MVTYLFFKKIKKGIEEMVGGRGNELNRKLLKTKTRQNLR